MVPERKCTSPRVAGFLMITIMTVSGLLCYVASTLYFPSGGEYALKSKPRCKENRTDNSYAPCDGNVSYAEEAIAKSVDKVKYRIKEHNLLPKRRKRVDRKKHASEEIERNNEKCWDGEKMFEVFGPDADDETNESEGEGRRYTE